MSTATLASPAVTAFAAAVRAALSDLPTDEVDDLTDGLEADLTERIADGGESELGDPVAYAEELRTAAGLPPRMARRSSVAAELRAAPRLVVTEVLAVVDSHPLVKRLVAFLASLRPAWWVFRAIVVTVLVTMGGGWQPISFASIVVGPIALVVSVQFGRGRWLPFAWMRALLFTSTVILIIATPFVLLGWATQLNNAAYASEYSSSYEASSDQGLQLNGSEVSNIYVYDAQGNPLSDVQLFDQHGNPLNTVSDPTTSYGSQNSSGDVTVPSQEVAGRLGWNVYPLAHVPSTEIGDDGTIRLSAIPIPARLPFAAANPLAGTAASPTAAPTASPSPTAASPTDPPPTAAPPTASPSPIPTP